MKPAAPVRRPRSAAGGRHFRGWSMVAVLALTSTVAYGALYYAFAVFLEPVAAALDVSLATVTGSFSTALVVSAVAALPAGRALDRLGARPVAVAGSALGAVALLWWSTADGVLELYLALGLLGLAWSGALYEPAFVLINRWFRDGRARALLVLTVVGGFASTIALPASQALIAAGGWRWSLQVLAAAMLVCAVLQLVVLRSTPEQVGLLPDGGTGGDHPAGPPAPGSAVVATGSAPAADGHQRGGAAVVWLTVAAVAGTSAVTIVAVHLVAYLTASGLAAMAAAWVSGSLGVLSVTGRILLTGAATRLGVARTAAVMIGLQSVGVIALVALGGPAGTVLFVLLFGAGFGIMTLARPAMLGRFVPAPVFGRVSGRQTLLINLGRVAAPWVTAWSVDATGSYVLLFGAVGACSLVAGACLVAAERAYGRTAALAAVAA